MTDSLRIARAFILDHSRSKNLGGPLVPFPFLQITETTSSVVSNRYQVLWHFQMQSESIISKRRNGTMQFYAGTYDFSLGAADGFPVLKMVSNGEEILQMECSE
jgi:hypothetical protein